MISRLKKAGFNVATAALMLASLTGVGELYSRHLANSEKPWKISKWQERTAIAEEQVSVLKSARPGIDFAFAPYQRRGEEWQNNWGFRGLNLPEPIDDKIPRTDKLGIVVIGDSFTEGVGVTSEQSYPSVLSDLMNSHYQGKPFAVSNLGVSATNLLQIAGQMRHVALPLAKTSPKAIIIYGHYPNDVNLPEHMLEEPIGIYHRNFEKYTHSPLSALSCGDPDTQNSDLTKNPPTWTDEAKAFIATHSALATQLRYREIDFRHRHIIPFMFDLAHDTGRFGSIARGLLAKHPYLRATARQCIDYRYGAALLDQIASEADTAGIDFVVVQLPPLSTFEEYKKFTDGKILAPTMEVLGWVRNRHPRMRIYDPTPVFQEKINAGESADSFVATNETPRLHYNARGYRMVAEGLDSFLRTEFPYLDKFGRSYENNLQECKLSDTTTNPHNP